MPKFGYSHYRNPGECGEFVFVTSTCLDFVHVFRVPELADLMAASLLKDCREYGARVHAFVVMPHHIHAVIRLPQGLTCSELMRRIKANSVRRLIPLLPDSISLQFSAQRGLNRRTLWMRSFRSLLLRTNQVFYAKMRYVHANPVTAGLCECEEDYRWSSARLRLGGRLAEDWALLLNDEMIAEFASEEALRIRQIGQRPSTDAPSSVN